MGVDHVLEKTLISRGKSGSLACSISFPLNGVMDIYILRYLPSQCLNENPAWLGHLRVRDYKVTGEGHSIIPGAVG